MPWLLTKAKDNLFDMLVSIFLHQYFHMDNYMLLFQELHEREGLKILITNDNGEDIDET
jgi:hypothetical protein